ncbi:type VI secretion system Vgr family protein [Flavisolibacter ginsenosidimutans]|uniref:Gp5/Type VI secretion system Vgr protein OB-fold domain-containing protein n=1 Tax=Flavisolibacter ginsenosidimutans TaxID=661481 RepID=A0A5B8UK90_9BACT|nr:phage baseplate assembly protein V [Flavisolibacter ginsenosidimutans]QEC56822.1 hypothetical protein FSB75_13245 [Flavisolibacter ginsenosidimutans]
MEQQVIADIEIEDEKIDYYSSIVIRQQFNAHHEFAIRIRYDVLERIGAFTLKTAQKKIGKLAIIKLIKAGNLEPAYEFRGLICEISMEQSDNFTSHLVLKGYSPTILLENGPHLLSFYKKGLQQIVQQITQPLSQSCRVNVKPQYKSSLKYICQYRESTFHFLNRLSSEYGEWCYYNGIDLFFGKPSSSPNIEIMYGADVHQLQLKLRILPLAFSSYAYVSKDDKFISAKAPSGVDGLDEYAHHALQESNKVFSEPVSFPVRQRVESKGDLDGFVKKQKTAMAADLEVLSGSSDNPSICIGAVADVKASTRENNALSQEAYGKFLITNIEHYLTENKRYYNNFEGIPAGVENIPVKNVIMPIAEPQIATVTDNADPDNTGRIRVQMLWQKESNGMTNWLRVMTSDAGSSDQVSKNRGFMFIPEIGDQVLVCFRYNDPDRPFVLGSIYHGKTGAGGGTDNNKKTLSTRSGHVIEMNDEKGKEKITITDKNKNTFIIDTVKETITINANSTINMNAPSINLNATSISMLAKGAITMNAGGAIEGAAGGVLTFGSGLSSSFMSTLDTVILAGKMLSASGGKNVKLSSGAGASMNLEAKGDAKLNSSKKLDISSKESVITGSSKVALKGDKASMEGSSKAIVKGSQVDIS